MSVASVASFLTKAYDSVNHAETINPMTVLLKNGEDLLISKNNSENNKPAVA
jgi:hypothetical protein